MLNEIKELGIAERIIEKWALNPFYPNKSEQEASLLSRLKEYIETRPIIQSNEVFVRLGPHIAPYLAYLLCCDAYEHGDLRLIRTHATKCRRAVVMGGGIGVIASVFAQKTGADTTVYDANPDLIPHIIDTGILNNVTLNAKYGAIAQIGGGILNIYLSDEFWASSADRNTYMSNNKISVPTIAFSEAISGAQSAFIDIEGGELDLFFDPLPETLTEIFIEIHRPSLGTANTAAIMNRIWGQGFKIIDMDGLTSFWRR